MTELHCLSASPCDWRGADNICRREALTLDNFNAQCTVMQELDLRAHERRRREMYELDVKRGRLKPKVGTVVVEEADRSEDDMEGAPDA